MESKDFRNFKYQNDMSRKTALLKAFVFILTAFILPSYVIGQQIQLHSLEWIRMDGSDTVHVGNICLEIDGNKMYLQMPNEVIRTRFTDWYEAYDYQVWTNKHSRVKIYFENNKPIIAYVKKCRKIWYIEQGSNYSGRAVRNLHK